MKRKFKKISITRKVIVYIGGVSGTYSDPENAADHWSSIIANRLCNDDLDDDEFERLYEKAFRRSLPIFTRMFTVNDR